MAEREKDTLYVVAAAYDDVDAAVRDYEGVKALYREVRTSHDFGAAVIAEEADGRVRIVRKHEEPTRHGAAVGLGWGLALGSRQCCSRPSASARATDMAADRVAADVQRAEAEGDRATHAPPVLQQASARPRRWSP